MLILLILCTTLLQTFQPLTQPIPQSIHKPTVSYTEQFDTAVKAWIEQLAEQSEFADWKSTTLQWDRQPIGPGMHGWVVILTDHNKEIGYLVVSVDAEGNYHLSEYGQDPFPLFSQNTLYHAMVQHELILPTVTYKQFLTDPYISRERIYLNPLQNIWLITMNDEHFQLDAKTGDLMSIDSEILNRYLCCNQLDHTWAASRTETQVIQQTLQLPAFDPYEDLGWIVEPPGQIKDLQQLQASLQAGQSLTYVISLFEDTVIYALSVTGYHQWNAGDPFIAIDQYGLRYIPALYLMRNGHYYVS